MSPGLIFDHIGIVVEDIDDGRLKLEATLGKLSWTCRFDDAVLGVIVRFARDSSGVVYEIIAPLDENSPVTRFLQDKHDTLNQLAFRTNSFDKAVSELCSSGCIPIGKARPAVAFGGALVQFLMTPLGFILELIQRNSSVHEFMEPVS